jgi:hypothetical protein
MLVRFKTFKKIKYNFIRLNYWIENDEILRFTNIYLAI